MQQISDASGVTSYASFGNIKDAAGSWNYDGVVLVCSKSEVIEADGSSHPSEYYSIYMDRVSYTTGQNISEIESKIDETVGNITSATGNDKLVYLLGEHVKSFVLKPSQGCIDDTEHKYTNPFAIDVLIEFEDKNWQRENIDKRVEETVYMRNQVSQDILYNGNSYVYDK